jgi:hypothetical protein
MILGAFAVFFITLFNLVVCGLLTTRKSAENRWKAQVHLRGINEFSADRLWLP